VCLAVKASVDLYLIAEFQLARIPDTRGEMSSNARPLTLFAYLSQWRSLIFIGCIAIAFVQAGLFARRRDVVDDFKNYHDLPPQRSSADGNQLERSAITAHPIPKLITEAETSFRRLLSKQSKTLKAAVSEYKRRYKRDPPKGFDGWWEFAMDNDVKMLDEYDGLVDDLSPFWQLSGEELRRRADQASSMLISWFHLTKNDV
jgi:hypothetical protein